MGIFSLLTAPIRIIDAAATLVEEVVVEPVVEVIEDVVEDITDKPRNDRR